LKPLVSVLIPAYNTEEWIEGTLQSVLGQTWERKEIIVVDDGSSDQTLAIARQFESDMVHVCTQKNQGAAAARNKAFSICQGDYIQWLDADDLLSPDKIAAQMEVVASTSGKRTLLSCPWAHFPYRTERAQFISTPLWEDLSPVEWLLRKMAQNLHMQPATWLVSRELTEAAGPWDTTLAVDDDGEYFCRVLLASDGVRFVPQPKVYYRASGSRGLSYIGLSNKKLDSQWRSMQLHIGYLRSLEDSIRTRAASLQYMQNWMKFFYPHRADLIEQMQSKAAELGGKLEAPRLSWKYAWIATLFGWHMGRRAELMLQGINATRVIAWDKAMLQWENWTGMNRRGSQDHSLD